MVKRVTMRNRLSQSVIQSTLTEKKQLQQDRFIFIATEKRYICRNCSGMKECRFSSRPKNPSLEFHLYLYCLLPKGFRLTGNVFIEIVRRRPHIQNSLS